MKRENGYSIYMNIHINPFRQNSSKRGITMTNNKLISPELNKIYKLLGLVLAQEMPTHFITDPDKKIEYIDFTFMIYKLNMTMEPYWSISNSTSTDIGIDIKTSIVHNKFVSNDQDELYYQISVNNNSKTIIYAIQITRDKLEYHLMENFNALLSVSHKESLVAYMYKYIKGILNNTILEFISSKSFTHLENDDVMVLCEDDEIHIVPYKYWSKNITI